MEQVINTNTTSSKIYEKRSREEEIERLREKARHDEAQALHHAKQRGAAKRNIEIARNLLKINLPLEQIVTATGLTREEVERLHPEI